LKVLVIGGTQFIGPFVVSQLTNMGNEVTVFHRGKTETDLPENIRHIHGDRANLLDFSSELKNLSPDVVLDMGLFNEADARRVVDAFKGVAGRIVAPSSIDVYRAYGLMLGIEQGPSQQVPIKEDDSLRQKLYPYRETLGRERPMLRDYDKILVEKVLLGNPEVPGTILRLPMVYGPRDTQHRLLYWLRPMAIDKRPHIVLGERQAKERVSKGYVENIARAIALAATDDRAANRIYNVSEENAESNFEWGQTIARAVHWNGKIVTVPDEKLPENARGTGQDLVIDTKRIRDELGFKEIVSPEDRLRKTIEWELSRAPKDFNSPQQVDYELEDKLVQEMDN
jgi:nucleoside-diphosphate-sugar epimerase